MLQKIQNFHSFQASVAQHSFRFSAATIELSEIASLGIMIPDQIRAALPKRQIEWVLGRHCARLACRELDQTSPGQVSIRHDRAPVWPLGLIGSITHTDGFISAAVGRAEELRGIGIDSEVIMDLSTMASVRNLIANSLEETLLENLQEALGATVFFTLIFSAKESIFKCLYPLVEKFFDFKDVEIYEINLAERKFYSRLAVNLSPEFPIGTQLTGSFTFSSTHMHTSVELINHTKESMSRFS